MSAFVIYWIAQSTRNGIAVYCAKYNLGNKNLTSLFNGVQIFGIHAAGFLTAVGSAFCIQVGSGFGAFLPLKIMNANGYVANAEQTPQALGAIGFCFIWLPVIVYAVVAAIMCLYRRFEKMEPRIKAELADRHAAALAAEA